jgi:hypothetical protein
MIGAVHRRRQRQRRTALGRVVVALIAAIVTAALAPASSTADGLKAMWGPRSTKGVSLFPTYQRSRREDLRGSPGLEFDRPAPSPQARATPTTPPTSWPAEVTTAVAEAKRYHMQVALQIIGAPILGQRRQSLELGAEEPSGLRQLRDRRRQALPVGASVDDLGRALSYAQLRAGDVRPSRLRKLNAQQQLAPHIYARILDAAYGALKGVSRSNLVIGGMTYTTGDISTQQWIENLRLPDGKPPRLDMYGHNPFSFRAPNLANPPSPDQQIDFSDLGRLSKLVDRYLGRPGNPDPKLFISEWTVPTKIDLEFNFYVEPLLQAQWITDAFRVADELPSIYALGWIHLYDEPPTTYGGLLETDGAKKPGYAAWKAG